MDIYGESPLKRILQGIEQIRNEKPASYLFVSPKVYRDINKMKRSFKRKKSDIESIKRSWKFPTHKRKIKFIKPELSLIDIDFTGYMKHTQLDIYRALAIPKEYLQTTI